MYKNRLLHLVVVVVMLMASTASGMATRTASAANLDNPFNASVSGRVSVLDADTFELAGTVKANRIGSNRDYPADGVFTGPNTDTLTETLTAANGDTLIILCNQVLEEISPGVLHRLTSNSFPHGYKRSSLPRAAFSHSASVGRR